VEFALSKGLPELKDLKALLATVEKRAGIKVRDHLKIGSGLNDKSLLEYRKD